MMYYYKRKSNPFKWVIITLVFMGLGALAYWFYFNYFSTINISGPDTVENDNIANINLPEIIAGNVSKIQGDVQVNIENNGYEQAIEKAVLHQGDMIKTGNNSLAVLTLEDKTAIRLGANTEIKLPKLDAGDILVELINGRIYNNISSSGAYQIKVSRATITSLGTKFEAIYNGSKQYLAVLVLENKANLELKDNNEVIISTRLDVNEKGLVDFAAPKKDALKIETFDPKILIRETW